VLRREQGGLITAWKRKGLVSLTLANVLLSSPRHPPMFGFFNLERRNSLSLTHQKV
jgi:hypothetical protein